jgi:hypothetical protein
VGNTGTNAAAGIQTPADRETRDPRSQPRPETHSGSHYASVSNRNPASARKMPGPFQSPRRNSTGVTGFGLLPPRARQTSSTRTPEDTAPGEGSGPALASPGHSQNGRPVHDPAGTSQEESSPRNTLQVDHGPRQGARVRGRSRRDSATEIPSRTCRQRRRNKNCSRAAVCTDLEGSASYRYRRETPKQEIRKTAISGAASPGNPTPGGKHHPRNTRGRRPQESGESRGHACHTAPRRT